MKNERMFFRCTICGNIVGMIEDAGPSVSCCGQDMSLLVPNTVDAAHEKHVPVAQRIGDEVVVRVGSVAHPMTEEHHISWIVLAGEGRTHRTALDHTGEPAVSFCVKDSEPLTVYAYCNLHGLWGAEL